MGLLALGSQILEDKHATRRLSAEFLVSPDVLVLHTIPVTFNSS